MTVQTRPPTGKPAWPLLLLAGLEKSGKSYAAAEASASDHIGRTFWVTIGEDEPDELGALPGARFEIVMHDGSYRGILNVLTEITALAPEDPAKPNLIVIDSMTRLWNLLSDMAQAEAVDRARRKRKNNAIDEAPVDIDLWNTAKQRWAHIIGTLKDHRGPVVLTARLESVTVMDGEKPTREKYWKVQSEKSLPFDVGAIVELRSRTERFVTGVRSLRWKPEPGAHVEMPDFTVEQLWDRIGVLDDAGNRSHDTASGQRSHDVEDARDDLLGQVMTLTGGQPQKVAADWLAEHGHRINETSNIDALRAVVEQLRTGDEAVA